MQDDRAFKCSRCGNYEYETELAEKVCKNCASKAVVENCHSLQQRYAKIANEMDELVRSYSIYWTGHCEKLREWSRQLRQ